MSDTYNKLLGLVTPSPKEQPVKKESLKQETAEKSNQQNDKTEEKKFKKSKSQQNDLSTNQHSDDSISTKTAKRFTTYLTKESLKAIRGIANDEEKFDYEIFQEAVDLYLAGKE